LNFPHRIYLHHQIGVNATKLLRSWNFDFSAAGALDYRQMRRVNAATAELDSEEVFHGIVEKYGDRWLLFHRADLHTGLRNALQARNADVNIRLATPVSTIDPEAGTVSLASGETVEHDLVIVADGSHSSLIPVITNSSPDAHPVIRSPMSMYRFLLPFPSILAPSHPASAIYKKQQPGFTTFYLSTPGRPGPMLNTYPCRNNELLYCALLHPTRPHEKGLEGWDHPAKVEDVMSDATGFHESVRKIVEGVKDVDVRVYNNMFRTPLPTFVRGRAVLVGDAAHLMLPTHGQGASQAMEDAAALGILFPAQITKDDVTRRLEEWNQLRLPRVRATQTMSNKMMGDLSKMVEEAKSYFTAEDEERSGMKVPGPTAKTFSPEYNEWNFGYDIVKEAERATKKV
jgi:salicylate hydroxylase